MAKMGRPKVEKPKQNRVSFRLDDVEFERLKAYSAKHDQTITQTLLLGVQELYKKDIPQQ